MTTTREIMTGNGQFIGDNKTLSDTNRTLPAINGHDLVGMLTQIVAARTLPGADR